MQAIIQMRRYVGGLLPRSEALHVMWVNQLKSFNIFEVFNITGDQSKVISQSGSGNDRIRSFHLFTFADNYTILNNLG